MAAPFPTRDPRCLEIIANVLYGLPPAPPGKGGSGVLDPQDGGAQAPRSEVLRPGRGREGRGYAPRPELPRSGRREEGRGDEPRPEVPLPGRGGEARGDAPRPEVPRPGRGVEGRGAAPLQQCFSRKTGEALQTPGATAQGAKALGNNLGASRVLQHVKDDREGMPPGISSGRLWQGWRGSNLGAPCSSSGGLRHHEEDKEGTKPRSDLGGALEEAPGAIIHDLQFLYVDKIVEALHKAKGLISLLRLDSILFEADQLESLFRLLVAKQVKEVILVNRKWPATYIDFPLDGIDNTGIERLRICFYKIAESYAYEFENLVLLDLAHCSIKSDDLKELVLKCKRLRELHLGYYQEDLHIHSATLVILQIWYSEMNLIEIHHAPQLQKITVSAVPKSKQKLLCVRLSNSPSLRTIVGNVSNQAISIKCHDIRRGTSLMPKLKNLYLGVCLSVQEERKYLLNIFKCFTRLEKLVLWRMDEIAISEASNAVIDDWHDELRVCEIVKHLQYLKIEGFKGGECELSIVTAFLKYSPSLMDLVIVSDNEDLIEKAKKAFQLPSQVTAIYQKSQVAGLKK